ncbi:MAG: hypothetical protein L6R41_002995 [Letrouitia leprolyta]|nr:MAG: hypothetical protein L6R41_002995 [Letrouitia leprolyta]
MNFRNITLPNASRHLGNIRLEAAGLVALADLRSIARWTTITGSASIIDILFLAPGIHRQHSAPDLNGAEYPPTGALTTGYVFRVENEATVCNLHAFGIPGHLVEVVVDSERPTLLLKCMALFQNPGIKSLALYLLGPLMTVISIVFVCLIGDWWALGILCMLIIARICNVIVMKRRSRIGWKGASEPGVYGDLLILLSQDRWIRLRGLVDDLKAVTSGQWLRDLTDLEGFILTATTMTVYVAAALANNSSTAGNLILLMLLLVSAGLLELINGLAKGSIMYGRVLRTKGKPISYRRRLDMVDQLIAESGRTDWAVGLGMISTSSEKDGIQATL